MNTKQDSLSKYRELLGALVESYPEDKYYKTELTKLSNYLDKKNPEDYYKHPDVISGKNLAGSAALKQKFYNDMMGMSEKIFTDEQYAKAINSAIDDVVNTGDLSSRPKAFSGVDNVSEEYMRLKAQESLGNDIINQDYNNLPKREFYRMYPQMIGLK